ncbi:MAG: hypothetical protein ACRDF0_09405 [Candidatus Limnocylindria bacterium]
MFDDLMRQLRRLEQPQTISIQMPLDDEGYFDRLCPAPACATHFKVLFTDWRDKVPDAQAWCAVCGYSANPSEFNTPEQQEYIKAHALRHFQGQLDEAFRRATPRTQKAGFVKMTLTYKPGAPVVVVPSEASEVLNQQSACELCGCRYASLGAGFFCPACGHNSALTTFTASVETIRKTMLLASRLPQLMDDKDAAADMARQFAEDALVRLWSSFQRFAEAAYETLGASDKPRRNAFQHLEESDRLWRVAIHKTYRDMLTDEEYRDLVKFVQQRHVRAHKDGLVDQDYIDKSGDHAYRVGQRLVVKSSAVFRLADIAVKLSTALRTSLEELKPGY